MAADDALALLGAIVRGDYELAGKMAIRATRISEAALWAERHGELVVGALLEAGHGGLAAELAELLDLALNEN